MIQRLILVRHGLTNWNHEFRYQGHTDIELNPEGVKQAHALKERIKDEKITAIYSSDLKRAMETARIIAEPHKIEVIPNPLFKEINFGVWEGRTYQELQKEYPQQLKIWLESPHLLRIENAETFSELQDRAMLGLKGVLSQHPSGTIVIVTHGGVIAALICGLFNEHINNMWKYKQKNASLNILVFQEDRVEIGLLNDISHLS